MQILVEIDEKKWQSVLDGTWCGSAEIANGIPLPNNHGRLIDENILINDLNEMKKDLEETHDWGRVYGMGIAKDVVRDCPETIKASSEEE